MVVTGVEVLWMVVVLLGLGTGSINAVLGVFILVGWGFNVVRKVETV